MSDAINSRARVVLAHSNICIFLSFIVLLFVSSAVIAAAGPTSTLYITSYGEFSGGSETGLDLVQGTNVNSFPTGYPVDICIGVASDVRTFGYGVGDKGRQLSLAGAQLAGGPYTNAVNNSQFHDGTSDGTYNYSVDYVTGNVTRFDLNWGSPTVLFTVTPLTHGFITMNPADNSFWLSTWGGPDLVQHFSYTGTSLGSFNSGVTGQQGLAFDPADGTLWLAGPTGVYTLYQFNQSGTLLQSPSYTLAAGQWYGMEFALPEPGTLSCLMAVSLLFLRRRRAGPRAYGVVSN